ncbi:MAG: YihA family ribosome biogenesis GTP-binding protein [Flammeovirgaceae bacterium]|nr:YihA family ribosome biogenesis GTP-binding protein [Flammeovirgaceae bacterium]MBE62137.1 YihA family ribosome biogenesis GTP-binding protein [Flammeovirgaceae bacterium]MBR09325.1 YihA family ribosome biogenesis GTP-binding protein [Rickettsiales bacterium]HCX24556.1 YihA family ribosome biogenesis GTP-binding protein [Cytophagales bacterium]|tara:strand:+ start:115 stop:723 length:609 start_codon:yes stop_codon:yes gene_type:complete
MNPIKSAEFIKSSSRVEECPDPDRPEYAFIGRSNVGKSSLINLLTNNGKLAKVSSKPGKTQLINHFMIDHTWYLVDLPGYGWARVSKKHQAEWKKMISRYFQERENLTMVFVLIDSRHDPQQIDLDFINSLGQSGIPLGLVFTKADKNGVTKAQSSVAKFKRVLKKEWEELPPDFLTSTVSGFGKDDLIQYIRDVNIGLAQQ